MEDRWVEVRTAVADLEAQGWRVVRAVLESDDAEGTHVTLVLRYEPARDTDIL